MNHYIDDALGDFLEMKKSHPGIDSTSAAIIVLAGGIKALTETINSDPVESLADQIGSGLVGISSQM